jgi:phosphoribosylformylglycinamidine cyclo-ligase
MAEYGIKLYSAGGETADVGDIVRTIDIGYTIFARMKRENLVVNAIRPNQVIIGLASYGKAVYEQTENSGIGSNGLTSARHDVLEKGYATNFPESYSNQIPLEAVYSGTKKLTDTVVFDEKIYEVGQLLLSPTRTFLPVLKAILEDARQHISGIIHCTGGGQTKVKKFIKNIHIVKDNLLPIPPVFKMIAAESNTPWAEMYQVFNMGTRLEIYTDAKYAENIIRIAQNFGIQAQIIGYTEASNTEKISIRTPYGEFQYA